MRKTLLLAAVSVLVATLQAWAGYGKIYIIGHDGQWPIPITENEDLFDGQALNEVSPNVYEGTFTFTSTYFRFITKLVEFDPNVNYWWSNTICPGIDGLWLNQDPASQVRTSNTVVDAKALPHEPGTWRITPGKYHIIVDLNKNRLTAIPEGTVLMLVDDESTPTLDNISDYYTISHARYVGAEDHSVALYDLFSRKWMVSATGDTSLRSGGRVRCQLSDTRRDFTTSIFWGGGMISGSVTSTSDNITWVNFNLAGDKLGYAFDHLYAVGDFSSWYILVDNECEKLDEEGSKWRMQIPAGTEMFKLVSQTDWDGVNLGMRGAQKSVDGKIKCILDPSAGADNITFSTPLASAITIDIDLEEGTVTMPAGTPMETESTDAMYLYFQGSAFMPDSKSSLSALSTFTKLTPDGEGNYTGIFDYTGVGFSIISRLADNAADNTMIAPADGSRYVLNPCNGHAYARGLATTPDKAGLYALSQNMLLDSDRLLTKVTVTPGTDPVVHFEFPSMQPGAGRLYIVGTPNGWNIEASDYVLRPTEKGYYYGEFNFDASAAPLNFRFYTQLGDWMTGSVGAQYDDFPVSGITNDYSGSCYNGGKGTWSIDDWNGGTFYCAVNTGLDQVYFSTTPLTDMVGEFMADAPAKPYEEGLYIRKLTDNDYVDGIPQIVYDEITRHDNNGHYYANVIGDSELNLVTRKLPISPMEPEWKGSYTLSAKNPEEFKVDEFGVIIIPFENRNYITTEAPEPFRIEDVKERYNATIDLNTSRAYFEQGCSRIYFGGEFIGNRDYGYDERAQLADKSVPFGGGIINLPAGDVNFVLSSSIEFLNISSGQNYDFDLAQGPVKNDNTLDGIFNSNICLKAWKGGDVFVTNSALYDFSTIKDVTAQCGDVTVKMAPVEGNVYAYTVDIPYHLDAAHPSAYVYFSADLQGDILSFGGGKVHYRYNVGEEKVEESGVSHRISYFNPGFFFPTLVGSGVIKAKIDFKSMTATFDLEQAREGNVYEVVSEGNPDIDGATVYPSNVQNDAVTVEFDVKGNDTGSYEFNLTNADGAVITPADGQADISFDANGLWSGDYTTIAPRSGQPARARAMANGTPKWHLNLPADASGRVSLLIDEKAKRITAFSSDCNQNYFIDTHFPGRSNVALVIENVDKFNRLSLNADGKYYGEFLMPESTADAWNSFAFVKGLGGTSSGLWIDGNSTLNLSAIGDETTRVAVGKTPFGQANASTMIYSGPAALVKACFDPVECTLTFEAKNAGVESVIDNAADIDIRGGVGSITVTAGAPLTLDVYNLQGVCIRRLNVAAGVTRFDMAPGLYIVNHNKVRVK